MDYKADKCNSLEQVLIDADKRPILLPFSLLKDITNDFSEERIIGRGGFADVYEGILKNGSVAVKKLSRAAVVDEKSFNKEIISLETVKHKNIVRFLGYCADTQTQLMKHYGMPVMAEIRERLLCFEYMPNGSLDKYIKDPSQGLEWAIRYQIIKGICEGLHYLHSERIVHLDLKPGNILLDCNMVPKIADFGLSKCFTEKQNEMTMTTTSGTLGYMAPEFHCSKITFQLDIFSLGAIITEILTGTRGYFDVNNVVESWKARFQRLQSGTWLEHVRVCAKIALNCMDLNPKKRPLTKDILDAFEELESEFGSIESNLSATHMDALDVYPLEVCVPWDREANRCIECPVTLINRTNQRVIVLITPTSLDTRFVLDFAHLGAQHPRKSDKGLILIDELGPRSTKVVFMTVREEQQQQPLRAHMGTFNVVITTRKKYVPDFGNVELRLAKNIYWEDTFRRIIKEELGDELYRATLAVTFDDPTTRTTKGSQQAVTTHHQQQQFMIPATNQEHWNSVDVHPTKTWVLVGNSGGYASIWNYETKERIQAFQVTNDCNIWCKFIAGEDWFVAGDDKGSVHVYSYTTEDKVKEFEAHPGNSVRYLAVHPTEPLLLTAGHQLVKLWDWSQGWTCIREIDAHGSVHALTFGPSGTDTFASHDSGRLKVWDLHSLDPVAAFDSQHHKHPIFLSSNHRHFFTAADPRAHLKIWDYQRKKAVHTLEVIKAFYIVAGHPSLPIFCSCAAKFVFLWDARTYRLMERFELTVRWISKMVLVGTGDLTRLVVQHPEGITIYKMNLTALLTSDGN